MSGVSCVWMIGDIVLPGASSCRQARLVRLTQDMQRKKKEDASGGREKEGIGHQ